MEALTITEKKVLNDMSQVLNSAVRLGNKIDSIISALTSEGTPVNAVAAKETLTFTGVVIDGETITIENPEKLRPDVYEFVADEAETVAAPWNIPVSIAASATASSGELTMDTQPTAGDTVTIGTKTYIFVPVGTDTADGEVTIGGDLAGAQAALFAAINGTDNLNTANSKVKAEPFALNKMAITALVAGVAGDAIATTETFTAATNVFDAATLGSGADCTAANAITALVAEFTAHDTQGVSVADGAGDTLVITADVAGASGNNIVIGETLANATFTNGATKLSGGVNGTIGEKGDTFVDTSYFYVCMDTNTTAGANWRRVSLGSVY